MHSNTKKIKAVLLAAGMGKRLLPLTSILPKCLMPINGRPLLEYWLRDLFATGVKDVLINTHYHADMVEEWLQGSAYDETAKMVHENKLLGTGGTVLQNCNFIGSHPALIIHADNLCQVNFQAFIDAHKKRPAACDITMMTFRTNMPETCGIVELDKKGVVQDFHEKVLEAPGNMANGAIYIIEPTVIDFLKSLGKTTIDFSTEVLPHYIGRIFTYYNNIYHRDIGNIESYLTAQSEFSGELTMPETAKDSWETLCFREDSKIAGHFYESLVSALHPIDVSPLTQEIPIELQQISENGKMLSINEAWNWDDEKKQKDGTRAAEAINNNLLLYFPKVNTGFSSKKIFERYGIRSLALCASNNSN